MIVASLTHLEEKKLIIETHNKILLVNTLKQSKVLATESQRLLQAKKLLFSETIPRLNKQLQSFLNKIQARHKKALKLREILKLSMPKPFNKFRRLLILVILRALIVQKSSTSTLSRPFHQVNKIDMTYKIKLKRTKKIAKKFFNHLLHLYPNASIFSPFTTRSLSK